MKILKKFALISIVSVGMVSTAFASWWNPTTWKILKKESPVVTQERSNVINVSTTTFNELTKDSLIFCNGSKYKKCPEGQSFVCPTNGEDAYCEKNKNEEIKTPKTKEEKTKPVASKIIKVTPTVSTNNESSVVKEPVITVPSTNNIQPKTKTCLNGSVVRLDDYCLKTCPDGTQIVENLTCYSSPNNMINKAVEDGQKAADEMNNDYRLNYKPKIDALRLKQQTLNSLASSCPTTGVSNVEVAKCRQYSLDSVNISLEITKIMNEFSSKYNINSFIPSTQTNCFYNSYPGGGMITCY